MGMLAVYAAHELTTSRLHDEPPTVYRSEYQRDRERIIRSSAFRRLEYKTQFLIHHEGRLSRNWLIYVLEVAQIGRAIARALKLNEDLTEAIILGQHLGQPPFGQAGEESLKQCMQPYGGFEPCVQALRIVDELEERYPNFRGLNLTFDSREGLLKECSVKQAKLLGAVGARFLREHPTPPSLEAQIAHTCEIITQIALDTDDALYARLISIRQLRDQPLFKEHYAAVLKQWPQLSQRRAIQETHRRMIHEQVTNIIETSAAHLDALQPKNIERVRLAEEPMITFSATMYEKHMQLVQLLRSQVYQHYQARRILFKAQQTIQRLFELFTNDLGLLPLEVQIEAQRLQAQLGSDKGKARAVSDYLTTLNDNEVIVEYEHLLNPSHFP
ncbi:MAG: deoxyguanosinetriphosphate triphosphohydrolase [Beggiatoa sp. IS2]|nr:MAG: deoxyguanosinetriphosphate triphosphohydrolase [Beggiatoa sp. IS2]